MPTLTVHPTAFPGTADLAQRLLDESIRTPGWRPMRAAVVKAAALPSSAGKHVWMTKEEFEDFLEAHNLTNSPGAVARLDNAIGMSTGTRHDILSNGRRITKVEALACAHFAVGLPLPVVPGLSVKFAAYFEKHFRLTPAIAGALEVTRTLIDTRISGRYPPDVGLIRALDWVRRVGPYSPFGAPLNDQPFPKG